MELRTLKILLDHAYNEMMSDFLEKKAHSISHYINKILSHYINKVLVLALLIFSPFCLNTNPGLNVFKNVMGYNYSQRSDEERDGGGMAELQYSQHGDQGSMEEQSLLIFLSMLRYT